MGGNTRELGRTSSSRIFALLDAFASGPPTMTLTELADRSNLPISTAHRLMGELADWGAVERNADGSYQVGARLWQIGTLAPRYRTVRATAVPFMEDLYEITHENVALAVRDGRRSLYLDNISGRRSISPTLPGGHRSPLHATAVGKVILAFSEPELLEHVRSRRMPRSTRHTITDPDRLVDEVNRTREQELGYSIEEFAIGRSSVAAPILGINRVLVAVLAIVTRSTTDVTKLAPAVRAAATAISRELLTRYQPNA